MKATKNGQGDDLPARLVGRSDAVAAGDPLLQPLVRSRLVEVPVNVLVEHSTKVGLVQDDEVIEALSPGTAQKPLADGIQIGRPWWCGEPAFVDGDTPGVYHGYFENQYGEQAIFTFDHATGEAVVRMGDVGWENVFPVVDGRVDGLVLGEAERLWARACWAATGGNRQAGSS